MRSRFKLFISSVLLSVAAIMSAEPPADTMTGAFDEHIRTMQVNLRGDIFAPPVIVLGSDDVLNFSFDQLSDDRSYLRYRLVHCNADWQPSPMVESEYLNGFNEAVIDDFEFSRGTTVNYVNYRFTVPSGNIYPLISGNYLVQVYDENDPSKTLAQWRFMVSEQKVGIDAALTSRTDIDYNNAHQQLSIEVNTERLDDIDPFNDLKLMIQQNGRFDNEIALQHPLRMLGRTAVYDHLAPLIFEAGNEYRRFETVSLDYPGMRIESVQYLDPYYHANITTDMSRAKEAYLYDSTQNGRFKIREYDSDYADTNADYVVVHFTLDYPETPDLMIFIDGDLTNRRFDESSRMIFNNYTGRYEKAMLLKQGSYNYQYLAVPPGKNRGYTSHIEGDRYQTVNEYLIKAYARRPGARYDRLVGVSRIVSDR